MRKQTKFLFQKIFLLPVLMIFITSLISCGFQSNTIAFYRVPENVQKEILAILEQSQGKQFKSIQLDSSLPFKEQTSALKNSEILFTLHDLQIADFVHTSPRVKSMPAAYLTGMPRKISQSVEKYQNVIKTVPILFDFYMIDVDYPMYKRSKVPTVDYWSDFLRTARIQKNFTPNPLGFAGAQDDDFINIFGMLTEAFIGSTDYNEALNSIYKAAITDYKKDPQSVENLTKVLDELTNSGGLLNQTVIEIKSLITQELLSEECFTLNNFNAADLLLQEKFTMFFTNLSTHRTFTPEINQVYAPIYCPAHQFNEERWFVAPEYCAIALNGSKETQRRIVAISSTYQTQLSTATGLGPVQIDCETGDEISNNVRYWLTASNGPLKPFTAALPSEFQRSFTSQYLRNLLVSF